MSPPESPAPKRRRITRACDFCHRRGRKCRPGAETPDVCSTCITQGVQCTWNRVPARRGAKPRSQNRRKWVLVEERHGCKAVLEALVEVFFRDVYPMYVANNEKTRYGNSCLRILMAQLQHLYRPRAHLQGSLDYQPPAYHPLVICSSSRHVRPKHSTYYERSFNRSHVRHECFISRTPGLFRGCAGCSVWKP